MRLYSIVLFMVAMILVIVIALFSVKINDNLFYGSKIEQTIRDMVKEECLK